VLGTDRVLQACFITDDLERTSRWFAAALGLELPAILLASPSDEAKAEYKGKPAEVSCRARHFLFSNLDVEFIEPGPEPSAWRDWLEKHGSGFHHLAFGVTGIKEKSATLAERGFAILQKGEFTGGRYSYLDTERHLGAVIELLEFDDPDAFPPGLGGKSRSAD
jgi:catechol 2,3-dioxygenase-like lactoylglutathione lyase family enzyme